MTINDTLKDSVLVIVGCGRLGSYLANTLSRLGAGVVVIDRRAAAFENLSPEFSGFTIEGDATEFETLKSAKAEKADFLVAATEDDNVNILAAQIAREVFQVPRVLARIFDMRREAFLAAKGIDVVCPTSVVGLLFLDLLRHGPANGQAGEAS